MQVFALLVTLSMVPAGVVFCLVLFLRKKSPEKFKNVNPFFVFIMTGIISSVFIMKALCHYNVIEKAPDGKSWIFTKEFRQKND